MGSLVLSHKELACNAGDTGSIPGSGRSPREGNGNPLQYSCLGNPMDRGAWRATIMGLQRVRHNLVTKQQHTNSITKDSFPFTAKISVKIILQFYSFQRLCYDLCSKVSLYVLNNLVLISRLLSTFMCIKSGPNDVLTLRLPNYA